MDCIKLLLQLCYVSFTVASFIFPGDIHFSNNKTTNSAAPRISGTSLKQKSTVMSNPSAREETAPDALSWDDATWVLLASFIIFTMQTGFGLLEVGIVAPKNEVNILMKNVVDIILGGFSYWIFGYSISFGTDPGSNPFNGVGFYAVNINPDVEEMGTVLTSFLFQLSFATTATTIVSGAVAERCNFAAYCLFSLLSTIIYVFPARWIWGPTGFLGDMGVIDIAGSGAVHLVGGTSAFVAAWMVGPRVGRYENGIDPPPLGNPSSCLYGLFNLWWGWLSFNAGSTYGVTGEKWKFAARAGVTTMISGIAGGMIGIAYSFARYRKVFVLDVVNPVLGALVGITASCAVVTTWEAFAIGVISAILIILTSSVTDHLRIDDAVGATTVHGFCGIWGMIAVGFFTQDDEGAGFVKNSIGIFHGGSGYLLGVQILACVCVIAWSSITTFIILAIINLFVRIRMEDHEQLIGADFLEHHIRRRNVGETPAVSIFGSHADVKEAKKRATYMGATNTKHDAVLATLKDLKQVNTTKKSAKTRRTKFLMMDLYQRWKKSSVDCKSAKRSAKLNNNKMTGKQRTCTYKTDLTMISNPKQGPIYVEQNQSIWNRVNYPHYNQQSYTEHDEFMSYRPTHNLATLDFFQAIRDDAEKYRPYRIYPNRNRFCTNKEYNLMD